MLTQWRRAAAFSLAWFALAAFVLHPAHTSESAPTLSSHCAVCHTVPMGPAVVPVLPSPIPCVSLAVCILDVPSHAELFLSNTSPRGPPVA